MKKIITFITVLLLLFIGLKIWYRFFGDGHNYTYTIDSGDISFEVNEQFSNDSDNSYYYFEFTINDDKFYYQTFNNFRNKSKIVEEIYYYNDKKYTCILPVFIGNKIISDIICRATNGYYYFYNNLKGMSEEVDSFAKSLEVVGYDYNQWLDNEEYVEKEGIKIFNKNLITKHYLSLTNYKGIYLINNKQKNQVNNELFSQDVYQKKFDVIYNDKYIVADYKEKYRFHEFIVIDISTGKKGKIISNNEISFDSYIQGIVNDKIYFFDKDSKKQYIIDMTKAKVIEVGNEEKGIKIYNGVDWKIVSAVTASNNEIKFEESNNPIMSDANYEKIAKIEHGNGGYYYYYKKIDDKYLVYRSNIQDNEQLYYTFTTTNIDNVIFGNNYIYFIDGEFIKRYSDKEGIRKIVEYSELKFNGNLNFGAYIK